MRLSTQDRLCDAPIASQRLGASRRPSGSAGKVGHKALAHPHLRFGPAQPR